MSDKGVCYAPVLDMREAWHNPHLRERAMILEGPDGVEYLGTPLKFASEPGQATGQVPHLGEHTDALLERLGYSEADRQRLKKSGVC